jgi:hypothetical protein
VFLEFGYHISNLCQELGWKEVTLLWNGFGFVEIQECPGQVWGDFATPVAFQIAAEMRNLGRFEYESPEKVSEEIIKLHFKKSSHIKQKSSLESGSQLFVIQKGERGFLNGKPTELAAHLFIEEIFQLLVQNENYFNQKGAIFFNTQSEVEDRSPLFFSQAIQRSELLRFAEDQKDLDIDCFLNSERTREFSRNDKLMLLGLLANRETSSKAYLSDISGKQNLPWYFNKYFEISQAYEELFNKQTPLLELKPENNDSINYSTIEMRYLSRVLPILLSYRFILSKGSPGKRAFRGMRLNLSLIDAFFAFYNYPSSRSISNSRRDSSLVRKINAISHKIIKEFIERIL